jgi:hypothetical protein
VEKVLRIKHQQTGYTHQQFSARSDQTVQFSSGEVRMLEAHARSKFCRYRTNFIFRQRGVLHPGINQHNMVIQIHLVGKVAIAAFGASAFGCECPSEDRDFLASPSCCNSSRLPHSVRFVGSSRPFIHRMVRRTGC